MLFKNLQRKVEKNLYITKDSPVTELSGCGKKRAELLSQLGIYTVNDLLRHFPRGYQDRGNVKQISDSEVGNTGAFVLTVASAPKTARINNGRTITKCKAFDGDRSCTLVFFNRNYIKDTLYTGYTYRFWGKLTRTKSGFELNPSSIEPFNGIKKLRSFEPIYPLTKGITNNFIKSLIETAMSSITVTESDDILNDKIRAKLNVISELQALKGIHMPENEDMIKKGRDRFVAEELFLFACQVTLSKKQRRNLESKRFDSQKCNLFELISSIPFKLTRAQEKVISDIKYDLLGKSPMARMVSGDVGSGKTVCAMAAAFMAIKNGYQCALMAPTEILVKQHYKDFSELFSKLGIECECLTGTSSASQRKAVLNKLKDGTLKMVVGTHALLSENVVFDNLGLVITDEQHRFGVGQRADLQSKADFPHVLVMSATPIPRSLALILTGDLDISTVDELPPGRQKVDTFIVDESYRDRLNSFIKKQVNAGRQVYIVCPRVESNDDESDGESDTVSFELFGSDERLPRLKSAFEYEEKLRTEIFPELKTAFLHGKMSGKNKDAVMSRFANGDIDILVSTTVIEVGVNVPNATLMIVENAERFGLSQLHQLRGRVGRGSEKSYCILVSDSDSEKSRRRLNIMKELSNGYEIAKCDLEMRGPGDFISAVSGNQIDGARQHGAFSFKLAGLCTDTLFLEKVFGVAREVIEDEKSFLDNDNRSLAALLEKTNKISSLGLN